jgi:NRAMP (natural resistance-associated macrophage protein)-like metal ion transporter
LITGASDDDPSGIATYAEAGARYQFAFLWTCLITLPLMAAIQEICDRTALATGKSLGALTAERFGRWRAPLSVLIGLLIVANTLNVAADASAIGEGMHLLHAGPPALWTLVAGLAVTVLTVRGSFTAIARVFKFLCFALLTYLVVLVAVHASWSSVLTHTLIPHIEATKEYVLLLVAVLGTTISPYLLFWQSASRIETMRDETPRRGTAVPLTAESTTRSREQLKTSRIDVVSGMVFSNVVMFAIIVATGSTIGAHHSTTIQTASQAASALRPIAGRAAEVLFAIGFIGSGMLALPVLAGSGAAALAGLFKKPWGFSRSPHDAPLFYWLVGIGTIGGTLLTLVGIDPLRLLVFSALVNGLLAAPFLVLVMLLAQSEEVMGSEYRNGRAAQTLGWVAVGLMAASSVLFLALSFGG